MKYTILFVIVAYLCVFSLADDDDDDDFDDFKEEYAVCRLNDCTLVGYAGDTMPMGMAWYKFSSPQCHGRLCVKYIDADDEDWWSDHDDAWWDGDDDDDDDDGGHHFSDDDDDDSGHSFSGSDDDDDGDNSVHGFSGDDDDDDDSNGDFSFLSFGGDDDADDGSSWHNGGHHHHHHQRHHDDDDDDDWGDDDRRRRHLLLHPSCAGAPQAIWRAAPCCEEYEASDMDEEDLCDILKSKYGYDDCDDLEDIMFFNDVKENKIKRGDRVQIC